jgi:hypothetical protein
VSSITATALTVNSAYFAYVRGTDKKVMERIGPHMTANKRAAAILRCLPSLRDEETGAP